MCVFRFFCDILPLVKATLKVIFFSGIEDFYQAYIR